MMSSRRRTLWIAGSLTLLAAALVTWFAWLAPIEPTVAIPRPALANAHPRVTSAVEEARAEIHAEPGSAEKWAEYGMLLTAHHFRKEAKVCFREAMRLSPNDDRWPYYLGYLCEEDDLAESVRLYEESAALKPDRHTTLIRLGNALLQLNKPDEAKGKFELALQKRPGDPFATLGLARSALAVGDLEQAKALFETAAGAPGWYPRAAFVELVRINQRLGDQDAARSADEQVKQMPETSAVEMPDPLLRKVESKDVLVRSIASSADQAAAQGDFAAAEKAFRLVVRARPDLASPQLNLANALLMQGRTDEALELFRDATRRFPQDVFTHFRLGFALQSAGDFEGAAAAFGKCVKLKPDFAEAWYRLGLVRWQHNSGDGAETAFRRATRADPTHLGTQLAWGTMLTEAGDFKTAVEHLEIAQNLAPDDPAVAEALRRARAGRP